MKQVDEFEDYKIIEGAIQFKEKSAVAFGCIGTLDGTSNTEEVVKRCEGKVIKKTKVTKDKIILDTVILFGKFITTPLHLI